MRSNKKGFTLIELLAVIVILAVIALIATPIVLSIITKARISAAQDSLYGVIQAARTSYMETLLDGEGQVSLPMWVECQSKVCTIYEATTTESGGKTTYAKGTNTQNDVDGNPHTVSFSGTAPDDDSAFALDKDGKVVDVADGGIHVNSYSCSITNEKVSCHN